MADARHRLNDDETEQIGELAKTLGVNDKAAMSYLIKHYCPKAIADFQKVIGQQQVAQTPQTAKPPSMPKASSSKPEPPTTEEPLSAASALADLMMSLA